MTNTFSFSIRKKIIIAIAATSLIASVIISIFSWYENSYLIGSEAKNKLRILSKSYAYSFDMNFKNEIKDLNILETAILENVDFSQINNAEYINNLTKVLEPTVKNLVQSSMNGKTAYVYFNPKLTNTAFDIYYADQTGKGNIYRQDTIPIDYYDSYDGDKSKDWWFVPVSTKEEYWSDPYDWQLDSGEIVKYISYTRPVYLNGILICVIGSDFRYDIIQNTLSSNKVYNSGYFFLLNNKLEILVHKKYKTGQNLQTVDKASYDLVNESFIKNKNKIIIDKSTNKNAFISYIKMDNGWVIGLSVSKNEIYSKLVDFQCTMIFFILCIVFLSIFLSMKLGNMISNPIINITHQIDNMSGFETKINFPEQYINRNDEIGILVNVVNNMNIKILEYFEQINEQNNALKQEVNTRVKIQSDLEMTLRILSGSNEGIFIADSNFNCSFVNKAFVDMTQYSENELKANNLFSTAIVLNEEMLNKVVNEEHLEGEFLQKRKNSEEYYQDILINKVMREENYFYIGIVRDLTEEKIKERDLYYLKNYDILTDLPNKYFFKEKTVKYIYESIGQDLLHAFITLNIDDFRVLNEAEGYEFGNSILVALTEKIKGKISKDDILSRIEGDEFCLFKVNIKNIEDLYEEVNSISKLVNSTLKIEDQEIFINVSVGVSIFPTDGITYEQLSKNSISALNHIKKNKGSSIAFYNENINKMSIEKYEVLKGLRQALEIKEFQLYYQPQIDLVNNKVLGVEALIRWKTSKGFIPPDIFIPLAEESRLIIPIGEWVLRTACKLGAELNKLGYNLKMGVNISMIQFKPKYLPALVSSVLEETNFPAELLDLEITESLLMENGSEGEELLKKLKDLGVKISVDDFGTGYSSLAYLKKFVVDKIKIDRSFIKDIPHKDNGIIANIIIQLTKNLGLEVIAEGAENKEQIDFLVQNGCTEVQGYYFSKPLPEEELLKYLSEFEGKVNNL